MLSRQPATPRIEDDLEAHRRALTGFCYRMLGCGSEAEDAVQETMVRAWRSADGLRSQSALRSWLYRIASNVCVDMLQSPQRRARATDLGPASRADAPLGSPLAGHAWVQPIADARVLPIDQDPAVLAQTRETLRLAFIAALQHLPPRQRVVLILRDVLRWQAAEVAQLLDTSVASVNSALQRARATLDALDLDPSGPAFLDGEQDVLLSRYVDAFERYDIASLVSLLHEDACFSMPPFALWVQGPEQVARFMLGTGIKCRGSRVLATAANGGPALGVYNPGADGAHDAWAILVIETSGAQITGLHHYIDTGLFAQFGLPERIGAAGGR